MGSSLVEIILNNLLTLMPFRIVMSYEKGVRWTLGRDPRELDPGFHWCLWILHTIEKAVIAEQVINLPTQSVMTKDRKVVCFSVNIGMTITDPVKHFCAVTDFYESTHGLAMTHLAQRVRELTFDEVDLKKLEASLRETLSTRYKKWGAEVTSVGFTDFVPTRQQIRLFQDHRKEI